MDKRSEMDPLLVSYLLRETNPDEDSRVREWIGSDEQNRFYFEELARAWQAATNVPAESSDGEWDHFQGLLTSRRRRKASIRKIVITTAVAASLLAVILWRAPLSGVKRPEAGPLAAKTTEPATREVLWQRLVNTRDDKMSFTLQDGSTVVLSPNSELSYRLSADNRDLALNGQASFTVAKDQRRPFSVFSGDLVTTALGTTFSITAFPRESNITIRLQEGKVVVRSVDSIRNRLAKDFFLHPGNELVYDKYQVTARLGHFRDETGTGAKSSVTPDLATTDSLSMIQNSTGSWYMFNNQSLDLVFDQLQEMFQVKIVYTKGEVKNKYFIGRFEKSDSVINILQKITLLNDLKLTKKENMFVISK